MSGNGVRWEPAVGAVVGFGEVLAVEPWEKWARAELEPAGLFAHRAGRVRLSAAYNGHEALAEALIAEYLARRVL